MTGAEQGFLLLTSHLGDPERKILTVAQFRTLLQRMKSMEKKDTERELRESDLVSIGYDRATAQRILLLLSQQEQLDWYVNKGKKHGCIPITRISPNYPAPLRKALGTDCPGCLWAKGDISLLEHAAVSLVGSRDLQSENRQFAIQAGLQAARQDFVLVSGNARGADRTAQESCMGNGGKVICVVADRLDECKEQKNILYLSEDGFDLPFSSQRALSRNRVIHALGRAVLVVQCSYGKGGTWDGTVKNLRKGFSPVFCFSDGSHAVRELAQMGAQTIDTDQLQDLSALTAATLQFL